MPYSLSQPEDSQGQPREKLPSLARGLSLSRTALNRDVVSFVPGPTRWFSHPSAAVNTSEGPVGGFRSSTVGTDTNTTPIKDTIIRIAGEELVISVQWPVGEGNSKCL